jgi:hypothetical protein
LLTSFLIKTVNYLLGSITTGMLGTCISSRQLET